MTTLAYITALGFALFYLSTNDMYYLILGLIAAMIAITARKD
jgi:hypothetical protein